MLAFFRRIMKSWVATAFMAVLAVSLSVWGIKDVFHPNISPAVITAGSHEVLPADFKRVFKNALAQNAQQSGQNPPTAQEAVAAGIDVQILQDMMADQALGEMTKRMGLTPADALIADQLKKQPVFFDRVTGKFDQQAYETVLRDNGLTPQIFEEALKDQISQTHLGSGQAAGLREPLLYGALLAAYQLEGRTLSYFLVQPGALPPPAVPTDAQLQDLINKHPDDFRRPEMRALTYVRFSTKALAPTLTPDPAELLKLYNLRKPKLSTPETRSLVEIPVRDAAAAQQVIAKLNAGQAPGAVAAASHVRPIVYDNAAKSAVADAKVADVAFALPAGQVSQPVETSLAGLAVIKVTAVTPAKVPSLEEARPQLETELRNQLATQKVYDAVQKYDDARNGGANMDAAAKVAGGAPIQVGPISANGVDMATHPVPGLTPALLKTAFTLSQGGESDLQDEGAGEYFAVRVDKIVAPALVKVDEVRQPLTQRYMAEDLLTRMTAKANELAAKIRKGASLEAAAAEVRAQIGHGVAVPRTQILQNQALSQELRGHLIEAKAGEVIVGQTSQFPVMVVRVDSVNAASPDEAAKLVVEQRPHVAMPMFQDLAAADRQAAKARVKPTYDLDKARSAIGVSPDEAPKAAPSGAPPARAP